MNRVVFILVDAMRWDYINEDTMPFLHSLRLSNPYRKKVIPSAGFCERNEIFTGKSSVESGFFTAVGYDKNKTGDVTVPVRALQLIDSITAKWPQSYFRKFFRFILWRYWKVFRIHENMKPYNIPLRLFPFLELTEDKHDHYRGEQMDANSIFRFCNREKVAFTYESFTSLREASGGDDESRLGLALKNLLSNQFVPVYVGVLDTIGHKFGPKSKEIRVACSKLDNELREFHSACRALDEGTVLYFLGDHGMSQVKQTLNVSEIVIEVLKGKELKLGRDYELFVDSTIVRIWVFRANLESVVLGLLSEDNRLRANGNLIHRNDYEAEGIPVGERLLYGDMLWWANDGVLISPDFFHKNSNYAGMHGYRIDSPQTLGTLITSGSIIPKSDEIIHLTDVHKFLLADINNICKS